MRAPNTEVRRKLPSRRFRFGLAISASLTAIRGRIRSNRLVIVRPKERECVADRRGGAEQ